MGTQVADALRCHVRLQGRVPVLVPSYDGRGHKGSALEYGQGAQDERSHLPQVGGVCLQQAVRFRSCCPASVKFRIPLPSANEAAECLEALCGYRTRSTAHAIANAICDGAFPNRLNHAPSDINLAAAMPVAFVEADIVRRD